MFARGPSDPTGGASFAPRTFGEFGTVATSRSYIQSIASVRFTWFGVFALPLPPFSALRRAVMLEPSFATLSCVSFLIIGG